MESESFDLSIKTLKGEMFQVNVNSTDTVRVRALHDINTQIKEVK